MVSFFQSTPTMYLESKYLVGGGLERQNGFFLNNAKTLNKKLEIRCKNNMFTQYLSYLNSKGDDSSFKIDGFMANYFSKLKLVCQA
jgi:hypothetical protein